MVKKRYIQPSLQLAIMDMEQMVANTPMTNGLTNPDGSDGDYGQGGDDDGSGDDVWGDVKGYTVWDNMW